MTPNPDHERDLWDFFIAHAAADRERAEELYVILSQNCRVFLDSRCLLPGDNWDVELSKAQRRSRMTLVLISANSDAAYYEAEEIATGIDMSRGEGHRHRVIPVFLERVPSEAVPYGLRRKHSLFLDVGGIRAVAAAIMDLLARVDGTRPTTTPTPEAAELYRVNQICAQLSYEKLAKSRLALRELSDAAKQPVGRVRDAIITELKSFLLDLDELRWQVIPNPVRELRKMVLEVLRTAAAGNLSAYFQRGEFEGTDLYGMRFRSERLSGVSFANCFLVEAEFAGADLTSASFAGASLRNADLTGANLSGTDFTDADWFNAWGLSESNLSQARHETLLECPADIDGMYAELKGRYALQFYEWSNRVQQRLRDTWREYLRPGGVREVTLRWR